MALTYLASWLPSLGGGGVSSSPRAVAAQPSQQISEEQVRPPLPHQPRELSLSPAPLQLHALHAQWLRMQSSHQAEALDLMGRLVAENNELKERLDKAQRDLKDVSAGRKADEEELKKAEKEILRLTGGNVRRSSSQPPSSLASWLADLVLSHADGYGPHYFALRLDGLDELRAGLAVAILNLEADLVRPLLSPRPRAGLSADVPRSCSSRPRSSTSPMPLEPPSRRLGASCTRACRRSRPRRASRAGRA